MSSLFFSRWEIWSILGSCVLVSGRFVDLVFECGTGCGLRRRGDEDCSLSFPNRSPFQTWPKSSAIDVMGVPLLLSKVSTEKAKMQKNVHVFMIRSFGKGAVFYCTLARLWEEVFVTHA